MYIKLNFKFIIAFIALIFVMHEAHEIVHTVVGWLICGCWGERDFNVWGLCEGCIDKHPIALVATFMGPLFTFCMIWLGGSYLKSNNNNKQKSFGFALIFANMPFARILTASLGSGDEVFGLTKLIHNHTLSWVIGWIFILMVVFYPLSKAYNLISNKRRIGYFLLFFLAPVAIDLIVVLGLMNTLLNKNILSTYWIMGSPILVTVWTASVVCVFMFTKKYLYSLSEN